jgi:hypothetical protein
VDQRKCCERDYDSDGNCDRHPAIPLPEESLEERLRATAEVWRKDGMMAICAEAASALAALRAELEVADDENARLHIELESTRQANTDLACNATSRVAVAYDDAITRAEVAEAELTATRQERDDWKRSATVSEDDNEGLTKECVALTHRVHQLETALTVVAKFLRTVSYPQQAAECEAALNSPIC